MTKVKCNHWCKHQENNLCTRKEIQVVYTENGIEIKAEDKNCLEFDNTKCECGWCEYSDDNKVCTVDNHEINDDSKCTNGEFSAVFM